MFRYGAQLSIILALGVSTPAAAQTAWYVDDDAPHDPGPGDPTISDPLEDGSSQHPFDAIRKAVDASSAGDEIVVADGTYTGPGNQRIFLKAGIYVHSRNGPAACIVELNGLGPAFYFANHADAVLEGVTVQNGGDAAIRCSYSQTTLRNCIIRNNRSERAGGGIEAYASPLTLMGCVIEGNHTTDGGGGIDVYDADAPCIISYCVIANNVAASEGGGISFSHTGDVAIRECLIANNIGLVEGGGVLFYSNAGNQLRIEQCTVVNNSALPTEWSDESRACCSRHGWKYPSFPTFSGNSNGAGSFVRSDIGSGRCRRAWNSSRRTGEG